MERLAIVLGAGGAVASAFHVGVLQVMEERLGRAASGAELLVGTSAGSMVSTALRGGVALDDIAAGLTDGPSDDDRAKVRDAMAQNKPSRWKRFLPLRPALLRELFPGGRGFGLAAAGVLPAGFFPTFMMGSAADDLDGAGWPDGLWINATRVHDGQAVVFGRDRTDVPVSLALQASQAVPGLFRPVLIDGERYVDGAVSSPTHAHLAIEATPDLVVVSSVQSRPGLRPVRMAARRRLATEVKALKAAGVPHVVVQPDRKAMEHFDGFPRKNPENGAGITAAGQRLAAAAFAAAGLG